MTELVTLLPIEEIQIQFESTVSCENKSLEEIADIIQLNSGTFFGMALNIWNRVVQYELAEVDPKAISDYVDNDDTSVYQAISENVGQDIIKDISYTICKLDDNSLEYKTVTELLIAHVFPNDIHIADVEFSNPYKPVPNGGKKRNMINTRA